LTNASQTCKIADMQDTPQVRRLGDRDREVSILLARAGFASIADLAKEVQARFPDAEADESTVWRYLKGKTARRNKRTLDAIAACLNVSGDELEEVLSRSNEQPEPQPEPHPTDEGMARYLGHADRGMPNETSDLVLAGSG
jgi:transcriptional regulator with XRE-family HTH domain